MFDKDSLTKHIKDQDTVFKMRQVIDKIQITQDNHIITHTDFLDPYQRKMAVSIINRFNDISFLEDGGDETSERKVIAIYPNYMNEIDINIGLSYLLINYKDEGLTHKDFLGALLSLGIKREKIGDIYSSNHETIVIVKEEISDFLILNLEQVKNSKVQVEKIEKSRINKPLEDYIEESHFISSFRLDTFISQAYKLSRNESTDVIKSGLVKVNHEKIEKASKELEENDLVSVRGKGRVTLYKVNGQSKKGRYNIVLRKLK